MALIRNVGISGLVSAISEAISHCTGALALLTVESGAMPPDSSKTGALIKSGNQIVAFAWISDTDYGGVMFGACSSAGNNFYLLAPYAQKNTLRVVATKKALSISNYDANGVSQYGVAISTDNNGDLCSIVETTANVGLSNPSVVPVDAEYTTEIKYQATSSTAFGSTALSYIPVPSYDGSSKYLPYVAFAHATQYMIDASVIINDDSKFYSIGGSWFLDDNT